MFGRTKFTGSERLVANDPFLRRVDPQALASAKDDVNAVIEAHAQRFSGPVRPHQLFQMEAERRGRTIYIARGPIGSATCGLTVQYPDVDVVVISDRVKMEPGGPAIGRRVEVHELFHYRDLPLDAGHADTVTSSLDGTATADIDHDVDAERREFWKKLAPELADEDEELLAIVRNQEPSAILARDIYDTETEQRIEASARLLEHYTTDPRHAMMRWKPRDPVQSLFGSTRKREWRG
ncbi:hypothetical protein [Amycolatopsis sp. GM8]|uniref:hypothetical protein n=1 Tax=Amycolatopsis sp. GM8 TaxID=2896530 RepID=UPI001F19F280|nr:hypothetical protein [Amycolatopsis sp. GM8]